MNKLLLSSTVLLALLPVCGSAQTTAPAGPAPIVTLSANAFEITPSPVSEQLDYRLLYNNTFNQVDLYQAKSDHLSDRQIAKIYKLAKAGRTEFRAVYTQVRDGDTFATLAGWYGVPLDALNHVDEELDEITGYESAYAGTGTGDEPRPGRVESSIDSIKHRH